MTHESLIGIDLGGTKIAGAIVVNGKIIEKRIVPTPQTSASSVIAAIFDLVQKLLEIAPDTRFIGLGTPGSVDHQNGVVRFAANIPEFSNVPLRSILSKKLNKTIVLSNDAKAAAIAEHVYGAAQNANSSMFITISTGIGGAIIQNNRIWYGAKGIAGEIGHLKVKTESNQFFALEHLASGTAIARDASRVFEYAMETPEVFALAKQGNQKALQIIDLAAERIGQMIANLQLIIDPDVFVIGGGVSQAGSFFLERISTAAKNHVAGFSQVCIFQAALGTDAGMIGAAYLAELHAKDTEILSY